MMPVNTISDQKGTEEPLSMLVRGSDVSGACCVACGLHQSASAGSARGVPISPCTGSRESTEPPALCARYQSSGISSLIQARLRRRQHRPNLALMAQHDHFGRLQQNLDVHP